MSVPDLSLTEKHVVLLVAAGRSPRDIAADLGLDERTVDWHLSRARLKLEQVSALHRQLDREIEAKRESRRADSNRGPLHYE